jgi:SAM-dependent methyltransferase
VSSIEGRLGPTFPEAGIDFDHANAARIYDYLLGGGHNFEVDRAQARKILAGQPDMARICRENRAFLVRAVRWCLEAGIDQFLDLGCGVPTVGNVHEVARAVEPDARVAYVDFEPVAVTHARELTAVLDGVTVTAADLRDPRAVLEAPTVTGLLDLTRPVALLAVAVLHFVPEDLAPVFAAYRAALAPGSALVMSHGSADWPDRGLADSTRAVAEGYRGSATPVTLRTRSELAALVDDWPLVTPTWVDLVSWPDDAAGPTEPVGAYAVVAQHPGAG